jgi:hypothetical protein
MYQQHLETQRHNRAQELADSERNRISEEHNVRSDQTNRSHYERQDDINRTHYANMDTETNRHNVVTETEANRHNVATEDIDRAYKTMRGISYAAGAASTVRGMMPQSPTVDTTTTTTTVAGGPVHGRHGQQANTTTTTRSVTVKGRKQSAPAPGRSNAAGKLSGFINDLGPLVGMKLMTKTLTPEDVKKRGEAAKKIVNTFSRKRGKNNE